MPNFVTRNLLICVVPTVVALLSVYWFRRKKKLKAKTFPPPKCHDISEELDSSLNVSSSRAPNSSETPSDTSSLTSPESSEKSLRTKAPLYKCETNDISSKSIVMSSESQFNHIDTNAYVNDLNKSEDNFYENALISLSIDEKNKLDHELGVKNSNTEKRGSLIQKSDASEVESLKKLVNNTKSQYSKDNLMSNHQQIFDASEALFKMLNNSQDKDLVIENGSLYSLYSNESPISSHGSDVEKIQIIESDSGDSHSSVLDENSLSYVSDESESRLAMNLKNKGSFSSVLDENSLLSSFCDESLKSNGESPLVESKVSGFKVDNSEPDEKLLPIKMNNDFGVCPLSKEVNDTINRNVSDQCSNVLNGKSTIQEAQNQSKDSLDSNTMQSPLLKSGDPSLDLITDYELKTKPSNMVTCSMPGDSNILDWSCSFSDKSSESSKPDLAALQYSSNCLNDEVSLKDKEVESVEPQIVEMNITEHLNMQVVPADHSAEIIEIQDSDIEILTSNKTDENEISPKVPETSSSQYIYEFDLPQDLCGRLIGKHGKNVKNIKDRSNANVYIKRHAYDPNLKTVVVEGNRSDVNEALEIIRRKYPPSRFPTVTLVKTNMSSPTGVLPESLQWSRLYFSYLLPSQRSLIFNSCVVNFGELKSICVTQLHLPDSVSCDVVLSSLVSAGHFFLQQPTHPTYPSLGTLDRCMFNCYQQLDTPLLPHPVEAGVICAAPVLRGWYRAQVVYVYENEVECTLKYVDYGGFSSVLTSTLRQIRSDFMSLPFQASECYLANVRPVDPIEGWSAEAYSTFEELAQGQILQAQVIEYAEDGVPCVHLYRVQGVSNMFINKELVERGLAVWVDSGHWDPH